jgi:menaquinone-dependent protoporphyrinogen oxidase
VGTTSGPADDAERPSSCPRVGASVVDMDVTPRALVAYATAAGSTAQVAEHIATVLPDSGAEVVCTPVAQELDPGGFDVLVVGSAVHNMAWLRPALDFLARTARTGAPTWCFSVGGLAAPYRNALSRFMARGELRRIAQGFPASLPPRDHRLFTGVVEMHGAPSWARLFYRLTGGGGDHRDWADIAHWAGVVAASCRDGNPATDRASVPRRSDRPGG